MTHAHTESAERSKAPAPLCYINTGTQITFVHQGRPYHILRSDEETHKKAVSALRDGSATSESLLALLDAPRLAFLELLKDHPELTLDDDRLLYRGFPVHPSLSVKLEACLKEGFGALPFLRFLENLAQNPRKEVMEHLYAFLEYGKMAIDDQGYFYAYKAVRKDFTDIYTGKFDNSVGQTLKMPVWAVDPDRDRTCSTGFHCCSFEYLPHFSHDDGHVMVLRVNPRDVVAVPSDYRNTKMRVSEYLVVDEYLDYYSKHSPNILALRAVICADSCITDEPFELTVEISLRDDEPFTLKETYALKPSAAEIFDFIREELSEYSEEDSADWTQYVLNNVETKTTLLQIRNTEFRGARDSSGALYHLVAMPTAERFEIDADEGVFLGTFHAKNRAVEALMSAVHDSSNETSCEFASIALFSIPKDSADIIGDAVRLIHCTIGSD